MARYEIDHLSASQVNLYLMCSLKYRFLYVDRLPKPFKSSGLAFGSVMHSSLDWFNQQRKQKRQVSLDTLYRVLQADWFCQKCEEVIHYKDGEDEQKLLLVAKELLGLYYHSPLNSLVDSEVSFRIPLVNPATGETLAVPLEGFIDLIESDDVLTEFKTSAKTMAADDLADMLQLTIYSYVYRMLYGREPQKLKVINFVKTRTAKMNVLEGAARKQDDYIWLYHLVSEVLKGIRAEVYFPRKSFLCTDCEYEIPCAAWRGNGRLGLTKPDGYHHNQISTQT
jgi:putative RecB family exonuclease